ncbi:hypothetical protein IFR05_010569 [Cadophora sp. M221]|nr:hypothetical protein IFR05_010569 [Cadophora sp. M221]
MSVSELHGLLVQLAQFCQANDPKTTTAHVLVSKAQISDSDVSALGRFFGLFMRCTKQILNPGISRLSSQTCAGSLIPNVGTTRVSDGHLSYSAISPSGQNDNLCSIPARVNEVNEENDDPLQGTHPPRGSNARTENPLCSPLYVNTPTTSLVTRRPTPRQIEAENGDPIGTLIFSPSTRFLLESCKTDRGRFLREIEDAKTSLPTGQGWEAAIATKKENADLRECIKIYHRFECYNIYKHVVAAGYHTGTHWIRDMKPALADKLCQEFPQRFPDQKTVNKSLNWVDQGCKYNEWTCQFKGEGTALGHLIALPLDVPHSAYTSRCTQDGMRSAAMALIASGIDGVVKELELAELGDQIAATLRDMTSRKRKDISGEVNSGARKASRLAPSRSPSHALPEEPDQNPTPPASLATSWDGYNYFGLEMDYSTDSHLLSYNDNLFDLSPPAYSGLLQNPENRFFSN